MDTMPDLSVTVTHVPPCSTSSVLASRSSVSTTASSLEPHIDDTSNIPEAKDSASNALSTAHISDNLSNSIATDDGAGRSMNSPSEPRALSANVAQNDDPLPSVDEASILAQAAHKSIPLTEATLAEQNSNHANAATALPLAPNTVQAWAADLPELPETVQSPPAPSHIFEIDCSANEEPSPHAIQTTKDVFTETQKIAYIGLCAVTSLEVVYDYQGKEFTYARMSADNWQRKLMRMLYTHMGISPEEITMIESLSKHNIVPTDLVYQFTSQGETATVRLDDLYDVPTTDTPDATKPNNGLDKATMPDTPAATEPDISDANSDAKPTAEVTPATITLNNSDDDDKATVEEAPTTTDSHSPVEKSTEKATLGTPESTAEEEARDSTEESDPPVEKPAVEAAPMNETLEEPKDSNDVIIDLRWTVICDLFLLCLSSENYDARSRVFIARIASYLSLEWNEVIAFEKRIAEHLLQNDPMAWENETVTSITTGTTNFSTIDDAISLRNDTERKGRNKQRKKKRYVMIGLATLGGGLILGLSAGLMAPVIAGGLGVLLTTVGVSGASGFLGGTAGIALITGGATVAGGPLAAKRMNKRMKSINTFEFLPVTAEDNVSCIISITGWLPGSSTKEDCYLPFSTLDPLMGDQYSLCWEPEMLEELGSAFKIMATEAVTFSIQQALAHTIMGALLAGLTWPLALSKLGYLVDNPWANGLDRARLAGLILADSLMNRNLGARPVTLIGYSLGARVIYHCLLELARVNAYGLVENVALFGTPVSASKAQWKECTTVVSGRFINGYATNDWLLGFLFRTTTGGLGNIAGLRPLESMEGNRVQNIDCTDLVNGHLSYRTCMPKLLKRAGFLVTADELPELKEKEKDKEAGRSRLGFFRKSSPSLNGSSATQSPELKGKEELQEQGPATVERMPSLSSLSSGKASIQLAEDHRPKPFSSSPPTSIQRNSTTTTTTTTTDPNIPSLSFSYPSTRTPSSSTQGTVAQGLCPSSSSPGIRTDVEPSDDDIIADILAKATVAAASKSGTYSSLSSGKASISPSVSSQTNEADRTSKTFFGMTTRSKSDTTMTVASSKTSGPSQSENTSMTSIFRRSLFKKRGVSDDVVTRELLDAGVQIKEIKSTLGCMVVPEDIVNPMPTITLEMPKHARVNR
ncbi:uncharacterized protein BYT42DRAFT_647867 [Radiomyces spectabilis]|uniref:uncharacterized protein n=1 Tax=Radiomyces spectabilis TaxID=64574 RepID=UPI00221F00F3|nr:uncharacterized protein BYT42DRAFT_647867 [Radiomyces spectabilis]KAI8370648.1 hypothetical protein BYT42DRAFT_647867 [Radiomyces spectabilis]